MATNTGEKDSGLDVKVLLTTLIAFRRGDFFTRMPNDWTNMHGKISDTLNEVIDMAERTTGDFERVSQVESVNGMAANLTSQVRNNAPGSAEV